jgi:hypothetical protein
LPFRSPDDRFVTARRDHHARKRTNAHAGGTKETAGLRAAGAATDTDGPPLRPPLVGIARTVLAAWMVGALLPKAAAPAFVVVYYAVVFGGLIHTVLTASGRWGSGDHPASPPSLTAPASPRGADRWLQQGRNPGVRSG